MFIVDIQSIYRSMYRVTVPPPLLTPFPPFDLTGPKDGSAWLATLEKSTIWVYQRYFQIKLILQQIHTGSWRSADRLPARIWWTPIAQSPRCIFKDTWCGPDKQIQTCVCGNHWSILVRNRNKSIPTTQMYCCIIVYSWRCAAIHRMWEGWVV